MKVPFFCCFFKEVLLCKDIPTDSSLYCRLLQDLPCCKLHKAGGSKLSRGALNVYKNRPGDEGQRTGPEQRLLEMHRAPGHFIPYVKSVVSKVNLLGM